MRAVFIMPIATFVFASLMSSVGAQETQSRGYVTKLDLIKGSVAIQQSKQAAPQSFSLANKNIPVTTSAGGKAKLEELSRGLYVILFISPVGDVVRIQANSPRAYGLIRNVDPVAKTMAVAESNKKTRSYRLSAQATVNVHGKESTWENLHSGLFVYMMLSLDQQTVVNARALFRRSGQDPRGVIVGVDAKQRTITLLTGGVSQPMTVAYPVDKEIKCVVDGSPRSIVLGELPVAESFAALVTAPLVWLKLDNDNKQIVAIIATTRRLKGKLVEVNQTVKRVTILLESSGKVEFEIGNNADVRVNGKTASLPGLVVGMKVDVTVAFDPSKLIRVFAASVKRE